MFVLDIYTKYQFTNIPHTYSNIQIPIYISICLSIICLSVYLSIYIY